MPGIPVERSAEAHEFSDLHGNPPDQSFCQDFCIPGSNDAEPLESSTQNAGGRNDWQRSPDSARGRETERVGFHIF